MQRVTTVTEKEEETIVGSAEVVDLVSSEEDDSKPIYKGAPMGKVFWKMAAYKAKKEEEIRQSEMKRKAKKPALRSKKPIK
jgi:hypothetical protein